MYPIILFARPFCTRRYWQLQKTPFCFSAFFWFSVVNGPERSEWRQKQLLWRFWGFLRHKWSMAWLLKQLLDTEVLTWQRMLLTSDPWNTVKNVNPTSSDRHCQYCNISLGLLSLATLLETPLLCFYSLAIMLEILLIASQWCTVTHSVFLCSALPHDWSVFWPQDVDVLSWDGSGHGSGHGSVCVVLGGM